MNRPTLCPFKSWLLENMDLAVFDATQDLLWLHEYRLAAQPLLARQLASCPKSADKQAHSSVKIAPIAPKQKTGFTLALLFI